MKFLLLFVILAVLHFGGIVVLPTWLVFAPLVFWAFMVVFCLALVAFLAKFPR